MVKAEVLPALIFLARIFPLPPKLRKVVQSLVFNFLWGGYEYVSREVMVQPVARGGRAVPNVALKLDVMFFVNICRMLAKPGSHAAFCFVRLWMSWNLRHLVKWDNTVPKAAQLPPYYRHAVRWAGHFRDCKAGSLCMDHRALYKALVERGGGTGVRRVEEGVWKATQMPGLENRVKDLNRLLVHQRLPVREVLYRHCLTRNKYCPRDSCMAEESIAHAFWVCSFAQQVWGEVGYEDIVVGRGWKGLRGRKRFLWWFLICLTKFVLWEARGMVVRHNVVWGVSRVVWRIRGEVRRKFRWDVETYGYHQAKERWKYLYE